MVSGGLNQLGQTSDPADNVEIFQQLSYGDKGALDSYPLESSLNKEYAGMANAILSNPSASVAQYYLNMMTIFNIYPNCIDMIIKL